MAADTGLRCVSINATWYHSVLLSGRKSPMHPSSLFSVGTWHWRTGARMQGIARVALAVLALGAAVPALAQTGNETAPRACDDNLKASFNTVPDTRVTAVMAFAKGDDLAPALVSGKAAGDLCMVRLLVGPGNPGPADAAATSPGIGVELWLPAAERWNHRLHALGGGGWSARLIDGSAAAQVAGKEGSIAAFTDGGHGPYVGQPGTWASYSDSSFMFGPDGKVSGWQWAAFGHRGVHEMAVAAKAFAAHYYGQGPRWSYFTGGSNGGRQGHVAAQAHPADFDGIISNNPAINWPGTMVAMFSAQEIMRRDLGRSMRADQVTLLSAAAVSACDSQLTGSHDGFISDPLACNYDPTRDRAVLCAGDGGANTTPACVTRAEARVMNRIWYGLTRDGKAPDPARDNGVVPRLSANRPWFGYPRGAEFFLPGTPWPEGRFFASPIALTSVGVMLDDFRFNEPSVRTLVGKGENGWRNLDTAAFLGMLQGGSRLMRKYGPFYLEKADLSAFKARGGKMIVTHAMADQAIPVSATSHFYEGLVRRSGGHKATDSFYRYYQIPGGNHFGATTLQGLPGISPPPNPPLPDDKTLLNALIAWVEQGKAPEGLTMSNSDGSMNRPMCAYPSRITYNGGDRAAASSYSCR